MFVPIPDKIVAPSISGLFCYDANRGVLSFKSTKRTKFSILLAMISPQAVRLIRAVCNRNSMNATKFLETNIALNEANGRFRIPDEFRYSITACIGFKLKNDAENMELQVRDQPSIIYNVTNGWDISNYSASQIIQEVPPTHNNLIENNALKCYNCNGGHEAEHCKWPEFLLCCPQCLVISFDGKNHISPCQPINRIVSPRPDIFAVSPTKLFDIAFFTNAVGILFLNEHGQMEILTTEQTLLSMATDGILSLKNVDESRVALRYEATSQSRFSILFAILDRQQIWRLRFRAVLTPVNGLLVFKLHSTLPVESGMYKIPQNQKNAIAVIGLKPKGLRIDAMCSVFTTDWIIGLLD